MRVVGGESQEWSSEAMEKEFQRQMLKKGPNAEVGSVRMRLGWRQLILIIWITDDVISRVKQKPGYYGLRDQGRQGKEEISLLFQEEESKKWLHNHFFFFFFCCVLN